MPIVNEETWWIEVYEAIRQIPEGRVTTYKHIAVLVGTPQRARQVGICLVSLPPPSRGNSENAVDTERDPGSYNLDNVPWQRVVNSKGMISHRAPGWAHRQAQYLRQEGVDVDDNDFGDYYIDMKTFGWFLNSSPRNMIVIDMDE
ncbi:MGMT family protein [Xylogone sp. PMI_703]|nr:MGMT family protein [Xylogone sp. PMI_703]